jgi:RNA polymerase sigma-70 factor (ECF subfamily)
MSEPHPTGDGPMTIDWPAVVREYGPVVWRTACRLLGNDADAADCFQNTFLAAVELAAAEPVRDWPAALKRIATTRALDQLRRRHRNTSRLVPLPDQPPADPSTPDPAGLVCGGELAAALRVALTELDNQQAEVFFLVCLEGLSNTDDAAQLGVTANHAGVLLHRARSALRERLAAFNPHREHASGGRP